MDCGRVAFAVGCGELLKLWACAAALTCAVLGVEVSSTAGESDADPPRRGLQLQRNPTSDLVELTDHRQPVEPALNSGSGCGCRAGECWHDRGELTFFGGLDGSKQPQDFGVNANLGGQVQANWGFPLSRRLGLGAQLGTGLVASGNAVRVYELLGEATDRTQSFTTLGLFQRTESGFAWGVAYDILHENSFDDFTLGQWRLRTSYDLGRRDQVGLTAHLSSQEDNGVFGASTAVSLRPISQGSIYWRHTWPTHTQTALWLGVAEGHGENNAVTGPSPEKDEVLVFGADLLAPLNDHFAIYGETNMITPADTGTVDAFLGLQWYPGGGARHARRAGFAPLLPVAAPTSFSVDLDVGQ